MNRKLEWIINQNRDEQTEPWIRLRYADAAPVKRTPMNRLDLITFLDELRPRYKPVEADGDGHCSRCKARCRVRTRLHQGGSNIRRKSFGRGIGHIRRS